MMHKLGMILRSLHTIACLALVCAVACGQDGGSESARKDAGASDAARNDGGCTVLPCPSAAPFSPTECRCVRVPSAAECSLPKAIDGYLEDVTTKDCGTLPDTASTAQMTVAQECVIDAIAAGKAFRMVQEQRGIDSRVSLGYAWDGKGPIRQFGSDSDPSGGSGAAASVSGAPCASLRVRPACTPLPNTPCLICEEEGEIEQVCRGLEMP